MPAFSGLFAPYWDERARGVTTRAPPDHQPPWTKEGWMFDHYLALRSPERSGLLAWSALPHAPVLSDQRSRRPAGRLRRSTARTLSGLAQRLDPQAGHSGPDRMPAGQATAC